MKRLLVFLFLVPVLVIFSAGISYAHCDGEDGPVVTAAKKALDEENVNLVLVWVQPEDETEIKGAFERTISVRKLDPSAKELADKYFYETVVRIHRMGEGASYTGVKPAGYNNDPSVRQADITIEKGSLKELYKMLSDEVHNGLHSAYEKVESLKDYDRNDVDAGREYVAAYVNFLHYAEAVFKAASHSGNEHDHNEKHEE
jgi:hypothetical protein